MDPPTDRRPDLVGGIGGALIGVVAGALSLAGQATAAAANAILGGSLSVGIGGAATVFLGGEHDFQHPRNQDLNQLLYEVLAREAREKSARERTGESHLAKE